MAELKPCPWCHYHKDLRVERNEYSFSNWYYVRCTNCDARGPEDTTEKEAIDAWNKRS